jgi:hypothetical protein
MTDEEARQEILSAFGFKCLKCGSANIDLDICLPNYWGGEDDGYSLGGYLKLSCNDCGQLVGVNL